MRLNDALVLVKNKRPIVDPNEGFLIQLSCLDFDMRTL